jgi:hypothetical protein
MAAAAGLGAYGGMWNTVITARIPAEVGGELRGIGSSLMYLDLIQARQLATQIQVIRETTTLENAELTLTDAELKRTEVENQMTINENMLQMATKAHAAAQSELTQAVESGTASSFQMQQANAILSSTGQEVYSETLQQISLNEQLAVSNNQVQIAANNVSSAQQILALDTQRNTDLTNAMNIAFVNTIAGFGEIGLRLYALMVQYGALTAAANVATTSINNNTGADIANAAAAQTAAASQAALAATYGGAGILGSVEAGAMAPLGAEGAFTGLEALGALAFFQHGGLVTSPTAAVLGEAGPEMVTPVGGGGMGGVTVNIGGMVGGSGTILADRISASVNKAFDRRKRSLTK